MRGKHLDRSINGTGIKEFSLLWKERLLTLIWTFPEGILRAESALNKQE